MLEDVIVEPSHAAIARRDPWLCVLQLNQSQDLALDKERRIAVAAEESKGNGDRCFGWDCFVECSMASYIGTRRFQKARRHRAGQTLQEVAVNVHALHPGAAAID